MRKGTALFLSLLSGVTGAYAQEPRNLSRSVQAIENFLGQIDASVLTGKTAGTLELPPPPPAIFNDEELQLVARAALELAKELALSAGLEGPKYFQKHRDSPKLEARPAKREDPANQWYPNLGPARLWSTHYTRSNSKGGDPPLESVRIPVDQALTGKLSDELSQRHDPGQFKDLEARARRLALFLAPKALADLELARIMEELELPNYVRVDALEEVRLLYELGALRELIRNREDIFRDPAFRLLASEYDYLQDRFGSLSPFGPSPQRLSENAQEGWEDLVKGISHWSPLFSVLGKASLEELEEKNKKEVTQILEHLIKENHRKPKDARIYNEGLTAEHARGWLSEPGSMNALREASRTELWAARLFYSRELADRAKNSFSMQWRLAAARAAALEFDGRELARQLSRAKSQAQSAGISLDTEAIAKELRQKLFTVDRAIKVLEGGSGDILLLAARELGQMGPSAEAAIPALSRVLFARDSSTDFKREIVLALGKMGKPALPALIKTLQEWSPEVYDAAVEAVLKFGEEVIPVLAAELEAPVNVYRNYLGIAEALGKIGKPALPALKKALAHKENHVRVRALWGLKWMGEGAKETINDLETILLNPKEDSWVRSEAVYALLAIGPSTVPVWIKALKAKEWWLRRDACVALKQFGTDSQQAIPHLFELAEKDEWISISEAAVDALASIGKPAIPTLIRGLGSKGSQLRLWSANALARIGPEAKEALPVLQALKEDEKERWTVRSAAEIAIKAIKGE